MLFLDRSKQDLTQPSRMSSLGQVSTLCWFSIEYFQINQNRKLIKSKINYKLKIYFIMAVPSSYICNKVVEDIIKQGGQDVSDKFIVAKYLNISGLNKQNIITNQLLKQAGVKSEHITIDYDKNQGQPTRIKKDQFMYKSIERIEGKKNKKILAATNINVKKKNAKFFNKESRLSDQKSPPSTQTKFRQTNRASCFIQLKDCGYKNQIVNQQEVERQERMRGNIVEKIKKFLQNQRIEEQNEKFREDSILRVKKNFKKQLAAQQSQHTYHIDGTFLVYPVKNKTKYLGSFPTEVNSKISDKETMKQKNKKIISLSDNIFCPSKKTIIEKQLKTLQTQQSEQLKRKQQETFFSNNLSRQITSSAHIKIKPGICFTEPSLGKSIKGQDYTLSYQQLKTRRSGFHKFVSNHTRSKTEDYQEWKQQGKMQLVNDSQRKAQTKGSRIYSRRTKTCRSGTIKQINSALFEELVST